MIMYNFFKYSEDISLMLVYVASIFYSAPCLHSTLLSAFSVPYPFFLYPYYFLLLCRRLRMVY